MLSVLSPSWQEHTQPLSESSTHSNDHTKYLSDLLSKAFKPRVTSQSQNPAIHTGKRRTINISRNYVPGRSTTHMQRCRASASPAQFITTRTNQIRAQLQTLAQLQLNQSDPADQAVATPCPVCFSIDCKLISHQQYSTPISPPTRVVSPDRVVKSPFTRVGVSLSDPYLQLPSVIQDHGWKQLFRDFYTIKSSTFQSEERSTLAFARDLQGHILAQSLTDPALCMACIALSAAFSVTNGDDAEVPDQRTSAIFGQSCRYINGQLSEKVTEITLNAVLAMVIAQGVFFGDTKAIQAHLRGAYSLVNALGGISRLNGGSVALFHFVEYVAVLFGGEPSLAETVTEILPLENPPSEIYGNRFHEVSHLLDQSLLSTCLDSCRLTELLERDRAIRATPSTWAYFLYVQDTLAIRNAKHHTLYRSTDSVAECISLTINLYQLTVLRVTPYKTPLLQLCSRLRSVLSTFNLIGGSEAHEVGPSEIEETHLRDIATWSLYVVSAVSQLMKSTEHEWAIDLLRKLLTLRYRCQPSQWPSNWTQHQYDLIKDYCWSDTILSKKFKTTCEKVSVPHGVRKYESFVRRFQLSNGRMAVASDVRVYYEET